MSNTCIAGPECTYMIQSTKLSNSVVVQSTVQGNTENGGKGEKISSPNEYHASALIKDFLLENSRAFRELTELRTKGWQATGGDRYFQDRRDKADNADEKQARGFFTMTCEIGDELDKATSVITFAASGGNGRPRILDMGMAPGGFTATVLKKHPAATVRGMTLPVDVGGLAVMVPQWNADHRVQIKFVDITMLADEMGVPATSIPAAHPDSAHFSSERPFLDEKFDLIFCGAAVQRAHPRAEYRESRERLRLTISQLVVALQRIRENRSLVVLLHKPEAWNTMELINMFMCFSKVRLFKPRRRHAIRSSFYMIATKIYPQTEAAQSAIHKWKTQWEITTFQTDSALSALVYISEDYIHDILAEFGPQFISLATPIWKTQAYKLRKASFM
ncbi:hypothetical protein BS50DRAFT_538019, partial [Corynespora cassiicola Philippines]